MTAPNVPSFEELLDSAQRSAVHLEMRDWYGVEREREPFAAWREHRLTLEQDRNERQDWVDLVARTVARGVVMRRTRVVSEPVTDYIRFEHWGTPVNVEAGERVRWLPRRQTTGIAFPGNDFWLIDERLIRWNHFSGDGAATDPEVTDDPEVVRLCSAAFEAAWTRAIPHEDYKIR